MIRILYVLIVLLLSTSVLDSRAQTVTWSPMTIDTNPNLNSVASNGSFIVATGDGGEIWTSFDAGGTFSKQNSGTTTNLTEVVCDRQNTCFAFGEDVFLESSDGMNWTSMPLDSPCGCLNCSVSSSGDFLLLANQDGVICTKLADAGNFTSIPNSAFGIDPVTSLCCGDPSLSGNDTCVASTMLGGIYSSNNPTMNDSFVFSTGIPDPIHGCSITKFPVSNGFVLVSEHYTLFSLEGLVWVPIQSDSPLNAVSCGGGQCFAVGTNSGGNGVIKGSIDGLSWNDQLLISDPLNDITVDNTLCRGIAVGDNGAVAITDTSAFSTCP